MRLIVTVPKLHKRSRVPYALPDPDHIAGIVMQGFYFEGEEADEAEVPNPEWGKWYKDRDGYFYWGGGIVEELILTSASPEPAPAEIFEIQETLLFDPAKMSWGHKFYNIPALWNDFKTKGEDVTVAVIDTGAEVTHSDLSVNIHPLSKSFIGDASDVTDVAGHGTQMAGIIAATGHHKVYGVAPASKLVVVKATPGVHGVELKRFADAIHYVSTLEEVDIVSVSYSFVIDDPLIKEATHECLTADKIVVAAIGNRRNSTKPFDDDTFPACYNSGFPGHEGVLGIGAFDAQSQLCSFSNWNRHIHFLSPGDFAVLTTGLGNTATHGSLTSIATAFTSGCLALMVSYLKAHNHQDKKTCIQAILETCDDMGPVAGFDERTGYGRMNLQNAFTKIKKT